MYFVVPKFIWNSYKAYLTDSGAKKLITTFVRCHYNGHTYVVGETFTAEDKCNECSCKRKGVVDCTKKPVCAPAPSVPGNN